MASEPFPGLRSKSGKGSSSRQVEGSALYQNMRKKSGLHAHSSSKAVCMSCRDTQLQPGKKLSEATPTPNISLLLSAVHKVDIPKDIESPLHFTFEFPTSQVEE